MWRHFSGPLRPVAHRTQPLALVAAIAPVLLAPACGGGRGYEPPPASVLPINTADMLLPLPTSAAAAAPPPRPAPSPTPPSAIAPSPLAGALPLDLDAPHAAHAPCKAKECAVPGLYPPIPAIDGKAPAAVWSHDVPAKGTSLSFPKHAGVDLYGVVLEGSVTMKGSAGEAPASAKVWWAFRAPGAGVTITADDAGTRIVLAAVTSGEPVGDAVVKLRGKGGAKLEWKKRAAPLEAKDLSASPDLAWAGGAMHARIGFEGESQRASLGVLMAAKDAAVAQHQHDTAWEILVALRADGTARRADGPGAGELASFAVGDGAVVAMPKATQHAWVPGGKKPLVAIQLYVPPGPEQRFKALAAPPAR